MDNLTAIRPEGDPDGVDPLRNLSYAIPPDLER